MNLAGYKRVLTTVPVYKKQEKIAGVYYTSVINHPED